MIISDHDACVFKHVWTSYSTLPHAISCPKIQDNEVALFRCCFNSCGVLHVFAFAMLVIETDTMSSALWKFRRLFRQVIAAFSPYTWSIGQNYLALIAEQVKERGVGVWEDWVNWCLGCERGRTVTIRRRNCGTVIIVGWCEDMYLTQFSKCSTNMIGSGWLKVSTSWCWHHSICWWSWMTGIAFSKPI